VEDNKFSAKFLKINLSNHVFSIAVLHVFYLTHWVYSQGKNAELKQLILFAKIITVSIFSLLICVLILFATRTEFGVSFSPILMNSMIVAVISIFMFLSLSAFSISNAISEGKFSLTSRNILMFVLTPIFFISFIILQKKINTSG